MDDSRNLIDFNKIQWNAFKKYASACILSIRVSCRGHSLVTARVDNNWSLTRHFPLGNLGLEHKSEV